MIELFVAVLLIPTLTIAVWDRLMHRMSVNTRRVYRLSGLIGVPIHELSHAVVCLAFGMRIKRISFYQANQASGTMGFVDFRYSPYSFVHAIGMALQGIAPLLAGAIIASLLIGSAQELEPARGGVIGLLAWVSMVVQVTLDNLYFEATGGLYGASVALLVLIISMHAIPSLADIVTGLRGLIMLAMFLALAVLAVELFGVYESQIGERFSNLVAWSLSWVERSLWTMLYGAVSMVTLAIAGGILLILLPSAALHGVEFARGARGKI